MIRFKFTLLVCFVTAGQTLFAQPLQQLEQQAIREAIDRVSPAVVQLQIIGGADRVDGVQLASGPATGVLISNDGYVVTSRYRFDPSPATVVAMLEDGRQFASEVVATDFSRKLVLLKLANAKDLPEVTVAPSNEVRVGQWAIALGKTYRVDRPNVSVGIVSALKRIQGRAMQTDAAVSAANYGGPLVDIQGRVIGIIAPMSPSSEKSIAGVDWYDSGIAFAAPLGDWMKSIDRLKLGEDLQIGYLGVSLAKGNPRETTPIVKVVTPEGPAETAGLVAEDLIIAIDGQAISTQLQLQRAIKPKYAGDKVEVTYLRDDTELKTEVELITIDKLQGLMKKAAEKENEEKETDKPSEEPSDRE